MTVWFYDCLSFMLPVWQSTCMTVCKGTMLVCQCACLAVYERTICPYLTVSSGTIGLSDCLCRGYLPTWLSVQRLFACLTVCAGTIYLSANLPAWLCIQVLSTCLCRDYVTEKLFSALQADVVPVVLGGVNYSSLLPPYSYIDMQAFLPHIYSYLVYLPFSHCLYIPSFYIFPPSSSTFSFCLHLPLSHILSLQHIPFYMPSICLHVCIYIWGSVRMSYRKSIAWR